MKKRTAMTWMCGLICALFAAGSILTAQPADDAMFRNGAVQRIADSYLSPLPEPPAVRTDFAEIAANASTGDIVIENNMAFPQFYAIFGTLMPGLKFIHAQMVITGKDLHNALQKLELRAGRSNALKVMRVRTRKISSVDEEKAVNVWEPYPSVDVSRLYCVGPEFVREVGNSYVVAMDLEECLKFPSNKFCSKALKLLRPRGITDEKRKMIAAYLAYHVFMGTAYDARFTMNEAENSISRNAAGKISYDFSVKPVPQYCTEIIHRALRFADLPGAVLFSPPGRLDLSKRPDWKASWWQNPVNDGGSIVVAEGFIPSSILIYENSEPFSVSRAIELADLLQPIHHEWGRTLATVKARMRFR